ncbi:Protein CBG21845 [Caenorhabditis briggsae]|uniref:Protein CBG21845 n=1 Tax=Caenorhabditis briggsae TaxID=6238 RepID=A8Y0Y7_CAEBR|nr:Protein CBG21845 [Caenorhabditis briggsae]CAP38556.2 Protein CBG21845 [Caenorhabditis briggsae]
MLASLATPRVFFPTIGGRPLGIFVKLGITVPVQLYVGFGCFGAMVASIILSFLYRHQVTVNQDNILKCNRWFQICVMVVNYVLLSNALLPALFTSPDSQLATKIEILRNEPCPAKDLLHPDSYVLQSSVDRLFPYFCGLVVFVGCQCAFMGLHCSWVLFFSTLTTKLSRKTRKMQAKLLVALVAQFAIPTTLCYCPMAYFAITTLVNHYWQFANDVCILIVSTHGLISATCLLLFYDCYRNHLVSLLCYRVFTKVGPISDKISRASINHNVTIIL